MVPAGKHRLVNTVCKLLKKIELISGVYSGDNDYKYKKLKKSAFKHENCWAQTTLCKIITIKSDNFCNLYIEAFSMTRVYGPQRP